jgi:ribosomal protein S6E (S10)
MTIKLDIGSPSEKKTFHLEASIEPFLNKKIGSIIKGSSIKESQDLGDYEFKVTGASHLTGIPLLSQVQGVGLKKILLTRGKAMKTKKPQGLRLKKTVHADIITEEISQVNLKVTKEGSKTLAKIFGKEEKPAEEKKEEQPEAKEKVEEKSVEPEVKEEKK